MENPKEELRKMTITLPQSLYSLLLGESTKRKIAGDTSKTVSEIIRETLMKYLKENGEKK